MNVLIGMEVMRKNNRYSRSLEKTKEREMQLASMWIYKKCFATNLKMGL
jgi:hypothetical protein